MRALIAFIVLLIYWAIIAYIIITEPKAAHNVKYIECVHVKDIQYCRDVEGPK